MNARIQKWGNSLAVRIPKSAAEEAGLSQGAEVVIHASKGKLVVRPRRKKEYSLEELLKTIRPGRVHREVDWGRPMGREVW